MNSKYEEIIKKAYKGFNDREIDTALSVMAPDVHWPRAFEGGHVVGHEAVRDYWTRQWSEINPVVEPVDITDRTDGKIQVKVKQVVKDMNGQVIFDGMVRHIYAVKDDLLLSMDIENG